MTQEIAIRNETKLAGLDAFARDNDTVMLAGDPLYFKKGFWFRGEKEFDPSGHPLPRQSYGSLYRLDAMERTQASRSATRSVFRLCTQGAARGSWLH